MLYFIGWVPLISGSALPFLGKRSMLRQNPVRNWRRSLAKVGEHLVAYFPSFAPFEEHGLGKLVADDTVLEMSSDDFEKIGKRGYTWLQFIGFQEGLETGSSKVERFLSVFLISFCECTCWKRTKVEIWWDAMVQKVSAIVWSPCQHAPFMIVE